MIDSFRRSKQMQMKTGQKNLIILAAILALATVSSMAQGANAVSATDSAAASTAPATPAAGKTGDSASDPKFHERYPRYTLRSGDAFDISFELSPEFNQQNVSIQPDGYITLRGVGDVHVAGETVPELTATLRTAYNKILNDPLISITLKDFERPYFIADGQVQKPGKYELRGDTTLTQAVAMSGGFLDSAKHSQVVLFRRVNDQWTQAQVFDVKKMENAKDLREDPTIHPGDMVFVPKNTFSKFKFLVPSASMGTFAKTY
jgi:polysaccharide biosynthesis/export protein